MMDYVYQSRSNHASVLHAVQTEGRIVGYFERIEDAEMVAREGFFWPYSGFQQASVVTVDIPDFRPTPRQEYTQ